MKQILILFMLLFSTQSASAIMMADYEPPFTSMEIQITDVDRSEENDVNLIITGDTYLFNSQKDTYYGKNFESETNIFIIRDKTKLIEASLQEGYIITAQIPNENVYADQREFRMDETNPSNIQIYDFNEEMIAETINLSVDRKGKQILHAFSGFDMIATIDNIIDCMPDTNDKVCHPELSIETLSDEKISSELVKTGDGLDIDLENYKSIFISDAHIYKQHSIDDEDYVRVQLFAKKKLEKYKKSYSSVFYRATSPEQITENPYCNFSFTVNSSALTQTCSWRAQIFNLNQWIQSLFKEKEPDYGMIAC